MEKIDANNLVINSDSHEELVLNNHNNTNDDINIDNKRDGPWNYAIEMYLTKIGKRTMGYRWMHDHEAHYYDKRDTKVGVIELIIITFVTILTGAGFANFLVATDLDNNKTLYIILSAIIFIVTFSSIFIKGYRLLYKYDKRKFDHQTAALRNVNINLKIQSQLVLNINDRANDITFMNKIIKKYNDLMSFSPQIRESTKKKYLEKAEENDIFNPLTTVHNGAVQIIIQNDKEDTENNSIDSKMKYQVDRYLQHM